MDRCGDERVGQCIEQERPTRARNGSAHALCDEAIRTSCGSRHTNHCRNESNMEDKLYSRRKLIVPTATVLLCVSRSRRWKSASTPSTPALSAARSPFAASLPASGTAALASAPWPVVLTPLRTSLPSHIPRRHVGNRCSEKLGIDYLTDGTETNTLCHSTPAAAAMRSTLRRLREIAEV